jgi:hypothetical protein
VSFLKSNDHIIYQLRGPDGRREVAGFPNSDRSCSVNNVFVFFALLHKMKFIESSVLKSALLRCQSEADKT